jgi:hypothetical protein
MTQSTQQMMPRLKLSTGYRLAVDLNDDSPGWRDHLARAILGERYLAEVQNAVDRHEAGADIGIVIEEIMFLLTTTSPELKDAMLEQIMFEDIVRQARILEESEEWGEAEE